MPDAAWGKPLGKEAPADVVAQAVAIPIEALYDSGQVKRVDIGREGERKLGAGQRAVPEEKKDATQQLGLVLDPAGGFLERRIDRDLTVQETAHHLLHGAHGELGRGCGLCGADGIAGDVPDQVGSPRAARTSSRRAPGVEATCSRAISSAMRASLSASERSRT